MGFDLSHVVSDQKHYGPLVCHLCENLTTLDAVVTTDCSHPFCNECLEAYARQQNSNGVVCRCPVCQHNITASNPLATDGVMKFGDLPLMVQSLQVAQPLAMEVLKLVQVGCTVNCDWSGDYGDWPGHAAAHGIIAAPIGMERSPKNLKSPRGKNLNNMNGTRNGEDVTKSTSASSSPNEGAAPESPESHHMMDESHRHHDLETSFAEDDWEAPISNLNKAENKGLSQESQYGEDQGTITTEEAIERSEKLKKQANAKFNKGDFDGARVLYSEGLVVMEGINKAADSNLCELIATLYSNRAVTFFREKNFESCIDDCDKALEYEPKYEKSYIRKWRALMALGNFEAAFDCLEKAQREIPTSIRVKQELIKAREQREILALVDEMIANGNLLQAKETIKPLAKTSDNINLLLIAAEADTGLGLTESALEKINKALRLNPNHLGALQQRGVILFLSGDMEKGVKLLQDIFSINGGNKEITQRLEQCQATLSAFSKGRAYAKRGRYEEAVEQFTLATDKNAMDLPRGTALYCLLKIERAEALLLSKQYAKALEDCSEALASQPENAEAWALKSEILIFMGLSMEAKNDLTRIRQTWGADNLVIDDAFKKASFEFEIKRIDDELMKLVTDIESGVPEKAFIEGREGYSAKERPSKSSKASKGEPVDRRLLLDKKASKYGKSMRSTATDKEKKKKSSRGLMKSSSMRIDAKSSSKDLVNGASNGRLTKGSSSRALSKATSARVLNTTGGGTSVKTKTSKKSTRKAEKT